MIATDSERIQITAIVKKFCNRCCYYWVTDGCQHNLNKTGNVIAECPHFREIKPLDVSM